ncbi:HprK-related kinase B [Paucidesulfovibrio longus]|uniref:HprK-related kinase B n=1 Tax=Paucidesulfovibrio longus TaxID=889 RepID=UPI0003B76FF0|nr:HprK-related kinase B [Paucidesulfovibrio longus]
MNKTPTCKALAEHFQSEFPTTHSLWLRFGEDVIEVRSNLKALHDSLCGYFKEFLTESQRPQIVVTTHDTSAPDLGLTYAIKDPDPGKSKVKEEYVDLVDGRVVRKRLTGMVFIFGDGHHLAVGPCLENDNQVVNFINNRFIERKLNQGCLLGHAAGVCLNGRGLALAGFSGMGKSTLALHLMSRGTTFVSNDRVMISSGEDGPMMFGVAKQPRINPGTALHNPDLARIVSDEDRVRFMALPADELWNLERKYDGLIDVCYGPGRFVLEAPLHGLVILNWKRDRGAVVVRRVDPGERVDLLAAFMKPTGLFYLPADLAAQADPGVEQYVELLSRCPLFEISGGVDFDVAADACIDFLKGGMIGEEGA